MDANDDEDSINRICLTQENVYGKMMELHSIDKVQGVIIRLRKKSDVTTSKNYLIAMLEELLKKEDAENKKKNLEEKYGFVMSVKTEGRLNDMCNLGEGLLERGIEEGIEQGLQKGMEKGIERGLEQGKAEGLRSLVETVKSLVGDDFQKVCEIIRKNVTIQNHPYSKMKLG